jgi:serine/threonine protein kinase
MGIVYEAEHTTLERRVALKVLPHRETSDTLKERFYREARAAARLHHTNIVPVFDFGEEQGVPYYAMQCIEGRGLDQLVEWVREKGGDLSSDSIAGFWAKFQMKSNSDGSGCGSLRRWQYIANLGIQAASAVQYAHEQGVIHRDIKPSNLLLDQDHHLWITDFGLAKLNDNLNLTMTGDLVGTLRYLPPESTRGEAGELSDVYGLGLVLYELAALQRPFEDVSRLSLLKQIVDTGPTRLQKLRPDVPCDLRTIIHKSIDREPTSRYPSAAALGEDLQRFLDDKPILARPHSAFAHVWRWSRRNRLAASLFTTVALLVIAGFVASTWFAIHLKGIVNQRNEALTSVGVEQRVAAAERDQAFQRLFESQVAQAGATRSSRQVGQRFQAIQAVEEATALLPKVDADADTEFRLRSELIGALVMADADIVEEWSGIGNRIDRYKFDFNSNINCVFYVDSESKRRQVVLRSVDDDKVVFATHLGPTRGYPARPVISPNGRWLSIHLVQPGNGDQEAALVTIILDAKTGAERLKTKSQAPKCLQATSCFDCGNHVAIADGEAIVVYDLEQSREVQRIETGLAVGRIALSRDARRVAVCHCDADHTVRAWDVASEDALLEIPFEVYCRGICWNSRGDELAIASDCNVEVWDVASAARRYRRYAANTIFHVAYSSDGECLVHLHGDMRRPSGIRLMARRSFT